MVEVSLIEQVKTGDLTAFEKLVQSTQERGLNIAYGILNDPLDAEDVLQEAYLQVYHNIGKLKTPEAFRSWSAKSSPTWLSDIPAKREGSIQYPSMMSARWKIPTLMNLKRLF